MFNTSRLDHFVSLLLIVFGILFSYLVPPNIAGTDEPQDVTVLQNRQVTLECKSDAVPPPVIMWLRNGDQLQVNLFLNSADAFLRQKLIELTVIQQCKSKHWIF